MHKFSKAFCIMAMSGVGIMALAVPQPAASQTVKVGGGQTVRIDPNGVVLDNNFRSGEQLIVENGVVKSVPKGSGTPAVWVFQIQSNGTYLIRNKADGTLLNLESGQPQSTNVPLNYATAWWNLVPAGNGTYRIKNVWFDKYLNTESGKFEASSQTVVPANYATSWWSFSPAPQVAAAPPTPRPFPDDTAILRRPSMQAGTTAQEVEARQREASNRARVNDDVETRTRPALCGPERICSVLIRGVVVLNRTERVDDHVYAKINVGYPPNWQSTRVPSTYYNEENKLSYPVVPMNETKDGTKFWMICSVHSLATPVNFNLMESDKLSLHYMDNKGLSADDEIGSFTITNSLVEQTSYGKVLQPDGGGKYTVVYEIADSPSKFKPCMPSAAPDPYQQVADEFKARERKLAETAERCERWIDEKFPFKPETSEQGVAVVLTYALCWIAGGPENL